MGCTQSKASRGAVVVDTTKPTAPPSKSSSPARSGQPEQDAELTASRTASLDDHDVGAGSNNINDKPTTTTTTPPVETKAESQSSGTVEGSAKELKDKSSMNGVSSESNPGDTKDVSPPPAGETQPIEVPKSPPKSPRRRRRRSNSGGVKELVEMGMVEELDETGQQLPMLPFLQPVVSKKVEDPKQELSVEAKETKASVDKKIPSEITIVHDTEAEETDKAQTEATFEATKDAKADNNKATLEFVEEAKAPKPVEPVSVGKEVSKVQEASEDGKEATLVGTGEAAAPKPFEPVVVDKEEASELLEEASPKATSPSDENVLPIKTADELVQAGKPEEAVSEEAKQVPSPRGIVKICAGCEMIERPGQKFKVCSKCRAVSYCGRECQVKHWKMNHKMVCSSFAVDATSTAQLMESWGLSPTNSGAFLSPNSSIELVEPSCGSPPSPRTTNSIHEDAVKELEAVLMRLRSEDPEFQDDDKSLEEINVSLKETATETKISDPVHLPEPRVFGPPVGFQQAPIEVTETKVSDPIEEARAAANMEVVTETKVSDPIEEARAAANTEVVPVDENVAPPSSGPFDENSPILLPQIRVCAACKTVEKHKGAFKDCAKCRAVFYCNKKCQKSHYKVHKKTCCKADRTSLLVSKDVSPLKASPRALKG